MLTTFLHNKISIHYRNGIKSAFQGGTFMCNSFFVFTNTSPLEYSKTGGLCMCEKVNFNVIEKNKNSNIEDMVKSIEIIVNKLIVNAFMNSAD